MKTLCAILFAAVLATTTRTRSCGMYVSDSGP